MPLGLDLSCWRLSQRPELRHFLAENLLRLVRSETCFWSRDSTRPNSSNPVLYCKKCYDDTRTLADAWSLFGKIFDYVILEKYRERLCTSELQFGFKHKSSTHACTLLLKEVLSTTRVLSIVLFLVLAKHLTECSIVHCSVYCCVVIFFRALSESYQGFILCTLFGFRGIVWCLISLLRTTVLNRVHGAISPVLFCIYIDDLLVRLSLSGIGCYIGLNFCGALGYADDIVLIAPTASAMCRWFLRTTMNVLWASVYNRNEVRTNLSRA